MALLSDAKARSIKPDDKPIPHGGITGLTLHPSTTKGRGKWVLRYVSPVTGKRRNAGLGIYPEISIAEVGNQARLMREQMAKGLDPLEVKKEEAAAYQCHHPGTYRQCTTAYLAGNPGNRHPREAAVACCNGLGMGSWLLPSKPCRCRG